MGLGSSSAGNGSGSKDTVLTMLACRGKLEQIGQRAWDKKQGREELEVD